jgi:hypothetical protein
MLHPQDAQFSETPTLATPYAHYDSLLAAANNATSPEEAIPDDAVTGGRPITIISTEYPQREATIDFFASLERARPRSAMRSNLSQEALRYSSAGGNVYEYPDVPSFPLKNLPYPPPPAPLMALIDTPRQSIESGVLDHYPFVLPDEQESSDDETRTLTESRDIIETPHSPAVVSTPHSASSSPAPYYANCPLDQRDYIFPADNAYYSTRRVESRQAILSLSSGANHRYAPRPVPYPPFEEWIEHVLIESVEDSEGVRLFEIISNPGYLLSQGRDLLCHGDLIGRWIIYTMIKVMEQYVYLTLFSSELRKHANVRVPFRYYRKEAHDWPAFFTVGPPPPP